MRRKSLVLVCLLSLIGALVLGVLPWLARLREPIKCAICLPGGLFSLFLPSAFWSDPTADHTPVAEAVGYYVHLVLTVWAVSVTGWPRRIVLSIFYGLLVLEVCLLWVYLAGLSRMSM
jgi:hypothetical protein